MLGQTNNCGGDPPRSMVDGTIKRSKEMKTQKDIRINKEGNKYIVREYTVSRNRSSNKPVYCKSIIGSFGNIEEAQGAKDFAENPTAFDYLMK